MHGGEASGVHSIRDTGWRTVNNHTDGQSVRMLPSVSLEVCHVLPDKPVGDTTIVVIVQQLQDIEYYCIICMIYQSFCYLEW